MLYVMTAADLGAVGPDVWDGWKQEVITDLYHRTMQHLAGESPETTLDDLLNQRRQKIRQQLADEPDHAWFVEHANALPPAYLNTTSPERAVEDLRQLHGAAVQSSRHRKGKLGVSVAAIYQPETATVEFTVATSENVTPGIFHRITGALSSHGLQIRSAQIHTLHDGLVLDRFAVHDSDYAGEPPGERLADIERSLVDALQNPTSQPPAFRRTWQVGAHRVVRVPGVPTRVNIDNSTSSHFTIIDIFTHDRTGLLYVVTRALFELGLSVGRAKIGTYLDQVVDVFYVTDRRGRKLKDELFLADLRRQLLEVVQRESEAETK